MFDLALRPLIASFGSYIGMRQGAAYWWSYNDNSSKAYRKLHKTVSL